MRGLLTGRRGWGDNEPDWSPSGRRIAFRRSTNGSRTSRIYTMRADGTRVRRITSGRSDDFPAWSPDGRWIAYGAESGLRLVRPDGSGDHAVPRTGMGATRPAWSPDSRWLSFTVSDGTNSYLVVQRPDGQARRRLAWGWTSDWSPDGRRIAITGREGGVYVIAVSGGKARSLGRGFEPVWSADGKRIAFTRWPADNIFTLWTVRPDGSARRKIKRGAEAPSWRPR